MVAVILLWCRQVRDVSTWNFTKYVCALGSHVFCSKFAAKTAQHKALPGGTYLMYVNYMCERDVFGCVLINPGVLLCHRLKKRRRSRIGWWVQCSIYYM